MRPLRAGSRKRGAASHRFEESEREGGRGASGVRPEEKHHHLSSCVESLERQH